MPETLTPTEAPLTLIQAKELAAKIKYKNPPTNLHGGEFAVFFAMGNGVEWSADEPANIFLRFRRDYEADFRDDLAHFLSYSEAGSFEKIGDYIIMRQTT